MNISLEKLVLFGFALVVLACQSDGKRDIEAYYLPLEELYDGVAYEYRAINNDTLPPYYWYFRTIEHEESTFLTGMYYNYAFTPQQFVREEKVANGMLLEEMFIYESDSLSKQTQIPVEVLSGSTFPFQVQDSLGVFLYKVQWQSSIDSSVTTIIRNRRFLGNVEHKIGNETYECVEFSVREVIDNEQQGFLELELTGIERYAKGVGLVYSERKLIGGDFEQKYQLVDRYPMEQFEAQFKEVIENK